MHNQTTDNRKYTIPDIDNELIDDLTNDEHIIYNTRYKQETCLNRPLCYFHDTYNN